MKTPANGYVSFNTLRLLPTLVTAAILTGCTHTYIGGAFAMSPEKKSAISVESHGASGKAYIDQSQKRIFLGVIKAPRTKGSKVLFFKELRLQGADVNWTTHWLSETNVAIHFHDFGPGKSSYDHPPSSLSNHLAKIEIAINGTNASVSAEKITASGAQRMEFR